MKSPAAVSPTGASWLTPRRTAVALGLIALAGWVLRALPFLRFGTSWRVPMDYDDGVYFAASALLSSGAAPYRDFVFVHPPGILLFLLPSAALSGSIGADAAFTVARWVATGVGVVNIVLVGRLALRAGGPVAALAAALLYAAYPEIASYERNPYLEPVLNLACLSAAMVWLSPRAERSSRWALLAGVLLGLAFAVKVWAVLWAVGMVAAMPPERRVARLAALAGGAALGAGVVVLPFLVVAGAPMLEQVVLFHLWRPADGTASLLERLIKIGKLHFVITALALAGLAVQLVRQEAAARRYARLFGVGYGLLLAAFLLARTYWFEYNSHLAPSETALAGLGAAALWRWGASRGRREVAVAGALLVLSPAHSLWHCLRQARNRDDKMPKLGAAVRALVPPEACFIAFEPIWGLAGGRLPTVRPATGAVVDVYAAMLLATRTTGQSFGDIFPALRTPVAQERIRALLDGCRFVALGDRGHWQLTDETKRWLAERYERRHPPPGEEAVDVWELREPHPAAEAR